MKTRILVAAIAIPILIVVLFFLPLFVWSTLCGIAAALACWELLKAVGVSSLRLRIYALASAFLIPFVSCWEAREGLTEAVIFLLFALTFAELIFSFRKEKPMLLDDVPMVLFGGALLPFLLASAVRLEMPAAILLIFIAAFSSDSGAYFAGKFLGRHKLSPRVSPNKTIEGSVGGFLGAIVVMLIYGLILKAAGFEVRFLILLIYGFLGSVASQLGDLSFSAIKRIVGIKDYSNLIPGHGGALDRLDSLLFAAPLMEILVRWVPAFWK